MTFWRRPSADQLRERERKRLMRLLKQLDSIPQHRRESELADARAEGVRLMLKELDEETTK